jgi:hypothetical protein
MDDTFLLDFACCAVPKVFLDVFFLGGAAEGRETLRRA